MSDFQSFPSIERVENIYCVISEKIDGTNGLIEIGGNIITYNEETNSYSFDGDEIEVRFGSRNRYITPEDDNYNFAGFFSPHTELIRTIVHNIQTTTGDELKLPIRIYGEWFGKNIQREYGLNQRYFMPFVTYWADRLVQARVPGIIHPCILYQGKFSITQLDALMESLVMCGSQLILEYMNPEGIVAYFPKYNFSLKETYEGAKWQNNKPKSDHDKKPNKPKSDKPKYEKCSCGANMLNGVCLRKGCPGSIDEAGFEREHIG